MLFVVYRVFPCLLFLLFCRIRLLRSCNDSLHSVMLFEITRFHVLSREVLTLVMRISFATCINRVVLLLTTIYSAMRCRGAKHVLRRFLNCWEERNRR